MVENPQPDTEVINHKWEEFFASGKVMTSDFLHEFIKDLILIRGETNPQSGKKEWKILQEPAPPITLIFESVNTLGAESVTIDGGQRVYLDDFVFGTNDLCRFEEEIDSAYFPEGIDDVVKLIWDTHRNTPIEP